METVPKRKPSFAKLSMSNFESLKSRRLTRAVLPDLRDSSNIEEKPKIKLENTYKMLPDDGCKFSSCKVQKEMYDLLQDYLGDIKYDPPRCAKLCLDLSVRLKDRIKSLGFPRYKIISNVIITQCKEQGLEVVSRSIWDDKNDNFAYAVYTNSSLVAIGIVHGIYFE